MDFKKLKNQDGLTGIDVVIAITIISIAIVAILALYTNIIVGSKKVTRTSAATRVATSILENIDSMYYAEVEEELQRLRGKYSWTQLSEDYQYLTKYKISIPNSANDNLFTSRITSGYGIDLIVTQVNGSDKNERAIIKDCPLVMEIKVIVNYKVSSITEQITLKTIKRLELLDECNKPDMNMLLGKNNIRSLNQINPIKWSNEKNSYIKTNETDSWYSYENKEWAKVVISNLNDATSVFDVTTTEVKNINGQKCYVWIPRFGMTDETIPELAFTYKASNDRIKRYGFQVKVNNLTKDFFYNGVALYDGRDLLKETTKGVGFKEGETGIWIDITGGAVNLPGDDNDTRIQNILQYLESSKYGPTISHISASNYY